VSGTVVTRERWHRELMHQIMKKLEKAGTPDFVRPTPYELGQLMIGVIVNSYTPKEGWNTMASTLLTGATFPEEYMRIAPELVGKPGVTDPRVPILCFPADPLCLVGFLHSSQNLAVHSYPSLSKMMAEATEEDIRVTLYGHVQRSEDTVFSHFRDKRHVVTWEQLPRDATVIEVVDPGGSKPWVMCWYLVDPAGRVWQAQEWPCPGWPVEGFDLGPWALPSASGKLNGDAGPAQKTRLAWSRAHYVRTLWEGRKRLVQKMQETGSAWKGHQQTHTLTWKQGWTLEGDFAIPALSLMDSRFAGSPTESRGTHTTVLEAMYDEENAIPFDPSEGVSLAEGDLMINTALNTDVLGLPGLLINAECQNTLFMFKTYTLPPYRENTLAKDEACKDYRDPLAYCLLSDPSRFTHTAPIRCYGGGAY
jgi:hypothetical protein